jgi:heat shock protein HslJ
MSPPDKSTALDGTEWVLNTLPGKTLIPDSFITLRFQDDLVSGTDGCNRYSGAYTASELQLQFDSSMATTMMACTDPLMEQASAYLAALAQVRSYRIAAGQLILLSADNTLLANLQRQDKELAGTAWQVTGVNNGREAVVSVLSGTMLTLTFSSDGKISGSAGCNNYVANYTLTPVALEIGPATVTRKMCGNPATVMEQEQQFLKALETVATAQQEGAKLELRTTSGALAVSLVQAGAQ